MNHSSPQKIGKVSRDEVKLLQKLYLKGPAAFGSKTRLIKYSNLPAEKVESFLLSKNAHTKYKSFRKTFPRLKVISYRINEIWSLDLAYMDKIAKYNNGVKYLLVAVDVLSRYVRVEPLKTKHATDCANAFGKMLKKKKPEKVWTDKGTEFRGDFSTLCKNKGIHSYTTASETKSAFAERNIRSLKSLIYKNLEEKWTWTYINDLQEFVKTINSRVNRVTKLAPNKVFRQHEPYLVSLATTDKKISKPKFAPGDFVRIVKKDKSFRKGYKQSFTDEVFTVTSVATASPVTYTLVDANSEKIEGKFYEPELSKVGILFNSDDEE